jgi:hypothetical protein
MIFVINVLGDEQHQSIRKVIKSRMLKFFFKIWLLCSVFFRIKCCHVPASLYADSKTKRQLSLLKGLDPSRWIGLL